MDFIIDVPGLANLRLPNAWTPAMIERTTGHMLSEAFAETVFLVFNAILEAVAEHGEPCDPAHAVPPDRVPLSDDAVLWSRAKAIAVADGVPAEYLHAVVATLLAMRLIWCPVNGMVGVTFPAGPAGEPAKSEAFRALLHDGFALHLATSKARVRPDLH